MNGPCTLPDSKPATPVVSRPWGSFAQYAHNQAVTVSLMTVQPGQRLSLQSHSHRAELWVVLDDGAQVQVGDEIRTCSSGDEIWIANAQKHRLSCAADTAIRVLEVAFGDWQQDDIERFEDDYRRS